MLGLAIASIPQASYTILTYSFINVITLILNSYYCLKTEYLQVNCMKELPVMMDETIKALKTGNSIALTYPHRFQKIYPINKGDSMKGMMTVIDDEIHIVFRKAE